MNFCRALFVWLHLATPEENPRVHELEARIHRAFETDATRLDHINAKFLLPDFELEVMLTRPKEILNWIDLDNRRVAGIYRELQRIKRENIEFNSNLWKRQKK